uniref:Macrophage-expressed gene 1 protein n=1 Tax=Panagrolaimus sp. ES5 TaxID=591445 RepID=A0AC34F095_9BILA
MIQITVAGILLLLVTNGYSELSDVDKCIHQVQKNHIQGKNGSKTLAGIVGLGWDDLLNRVTIPVLKTSFKECQYVPDNDFLLPDAVVAIPVKDIALDRSSATFESYDEYMKESSDKISVSASGSFQGVSGGGSFSYENQESKRDFFKSNSFMLQNKITYKAYQLIANQHGGLDEHFIFRLNDISKAIYDGKHFLAKYKSEKLIYDYGTHVVNKATVGARVEQQVFIQNSEKFHGESRMSAIKAEASAGMEGVFSVSVGYENKRKSSETHSSKSSSTKTIIRTKGGPNINRLSGQANESVLFMDNLVGLDQEGIYLYDIINVAKIDYRDDIRIKLEHYVYNATMDYYLYNTIPGCLNSTAESFNFMATIEDGSCIAADKQFGFGGFYQTCQNVRSYTDTYDNLHFGPQCKKYQIPNPVTGGTTCPDTFEPVHINRETFNVQNRTLPKLKTDCTFWFITYPCLSKEFYHETITDVITIETFWCKKEERKSVPTTKTPPIPNKLDVIMDKKILAALETSPHLLKMYFEEEYGPTTTFKEVGVIVKEVTPPSFVIRKDQIDDLSYYPSILKELIPKLDITKGKLDNYTTEALDQLAKNPILLKFLFPGYDEEIKEVTPPISAALFGGIFGEGHINVFTGQPSCPLNFVEYTFLLDLKICIWNDTKEVWPISLGGIFDCHANSLICPRGFSRYIATLHDTCPVYYCIRMINRKTFESPVINRPPFTSREIAMEEIQSKK